MLPMITVAVLLGISQDPMQACGMNSTQFHIGIRIVPLGYPVRPVEQRRWRLAPGKAAIRRRSSVVLHF